MNRLVSILILALGLLLAPATVEAHSCCSSKEEVPSCESELPVSQDASDSCPYSSCICTCCGTIIALPALTVKVASISVEPPLESPTIYTELKERLLIMPQWRPPRQL